MDGGKLPVAPSILSVFPLRCGSCGNMNAWEIGVRAHSQMARIVAVRCLCGHTLSVSEDAFLNMHGQVEECHLRAKITLE